ncbi:jg26706 [Pararge aegeria aegeria]|uniref:Jg26706 protein n=1 Tax=Pararge aegeria aegeria TaxID=348720 RepID=A0A8S4R3M3_9NEOP|nr:jg26706 [Pararge aegeria aegeria]
MTSPDDSPKQYDNNLTADWRSGQRPCFPSPRPWIRFPQLENEWHDMESMQEENGRIREEIDALRSKYDALKRFAHLKSIPLPPELDMLP